MTPPGTPASPIFEPGSLDGSPLSRAPEAGTQAASSFNPNMFGDLFGAVARPVTVTNQRMFNDYVRGPQSELRRFTVPTIQAVGDTLVPDGLIVVRDNGKQSPAFFSNYTAGAGNSVQQNGAFTSALQALNPNSTVKFVSAQTAPGGFVSETPAFLILQGYQISTELGSALLPSAGGVVGKTKISDDGNPLPRDRVIFLYDYFNNVPLTPNGFDVHRFSPGFEKTFFDGWTSIELRFPLASTLNSTATLDGISSRDTEFGNINMTLKTLLMRGDVLNVAGGVGINFPTAADAVVRSSNGSEVIRINNESYTITPYIAGLYTPGDRFFSQAWLQLSYDTSGSPVQVANNGFGPMTNIGRVYDQTLLQADFQMGYWIMRDPYSNLRGLAPFVELHYNTPLNTKSGLASNGFVIGGAGNFDELNLSTGITAQFGTNSLVSLGVAVPLNSGLNRFFDYQIGVRANWFFGPTARARELAEAQGRRSDNVNAGDFSTGGQAAGSASMGGAGGGSMYGAGTASVGSGGDALAATHPRTMPGNVNDPRSPSSLPGSTTSGAMEGTTGSSTSPITDTLSRAPETGVLASSSFNPNFFGDQIGASRTVRLSQIPGMPGNSKDPVRIPLLPRYNGLKVTDNDGPRPQDRFYFTYNNYSGVNKSVNPASTPDIYLDREIIGLEKTFFGGDMSIGARLPFVQSGGAPGFEAQDVGDLSISTKYAFINDPGTKNVASVGLILTLPTGGRGESLSLMDTGEIAPRSVFIQPWAGAVWNAGDAFVQGVSSLLIPTDSIYPTAFFNSVGIGYWLYQSETDRLVKAIAPVMELHVNTPLTQRGDDAPIFFKDQVNLTTGLFVVFPRMTIGGSVCVPLVGPKPYDLEAMGSINYQF
jgi:hypothetical protein